METIDVESARKDLKNLISWVQDHKAVTVTSDNGNAVIVSEEDWDSILETLYVTGDPDFRKNLEMARNTPLNERELWNR